MVLWNQVLLEAWISIRAALSWWVRSCFLHSDSTKASLVWASSNSSSRTCKGQGTVTHLTHLQGTVTHLTHLQGTVTHLTYLQGTWDSYPPHIPARDMGQLPTLHTCKGHGTVTHLTYLQGTWDSYPPYTPARDRGQLHTLHTCTGQGTVTHLTHLQGTWDSYPPHTPARDSYPPPPQTPDVPVPNPSQQTASETLAHSRMQACQNSYSNCISILTQQHLKKSSSWCIQASRALESRTNRAMFADKQNRNKSFRYCNI